MLKENATRARATARWLVSLIVIGFWSVSVHAQGQSFVERNTNAQGVTPPGEYQGKRGMQDNETSCGNNPLLPRNIACAWNSSAGSDGPIGDTWVKWSESVDGETFVNQFVNGSKLDPATSINQDFAADPIMMCWPGGCGAIIIASKRSALGGAGGGIYFQVAPDMNLDTGFRHALSTTLDPVYESGPTEFADKPYAIYMLDETNPDTVDVSYTVERADGGTELVERSWPKARIIVGFALGDPDVDAIKLLSTYSDDYGKTWSVPFEITDRGYWIDSIRTPNKCKKNPGMDECKEFLPSGLNQGLNISAIGNNVLFSFRVFENPDQPSSIQGAMSTDWGQSVGVPFDIVSPFCAYDVPTLPNASNSSIAASRTNAFPWSSNNGFKHVLVYAEHQLSSDGGCFTTFDAPIDSRVKAIIGSADGSTWSDPAEIAPNPGHGFQFQPVIECSLGFCQAAFWDSRYDSERVINYLENAISMASEPRATTLADALEAFLNFPVLGDFNYPTGPETLMQFRRTARQMTTKVDITGAIPVATDNPPVVVSKYRRALIDGTVREIERNPWNVKAYKTSTVPFMGDYSWIAAVLQRLRENPVDPTAAPQWTENRSADLLNPHKSPEFWLSFVTARNLRGHLYTANISDPIPYNDTPEAPGSSNLEDPDSPPPEPGMESDQKTMHANALEDFNPSADFCVPTGNPGPGVIFQSPNNNTKDFDIYGAWIQSQVSAFSLNPTKTLNIQRPYTFVVENETQEPKSFRLFIKNQPIGYPADARASWRQLPFDPADPDFATTLPDEEEIVHVGQMSSESLALFVVSSIPVNPVSVDIFELLDGGGAVLIETITVDGIAEDGDFLNEDGSVNNFETHNPFVYFPTQFNPDEYNPDEYNPDEFNPDVYTPDEFNPDEFNPDEFNPDEFNPDEYNPDEFNPDEFNPDEFNPAVFNPDEFNAPLIDPGSLENPEIPAPDTSTLPEQVSNFEINYGIRNDGNAITPYVLDFMYPDEDIQALFTSGLLVAQIIAWQDSKTEDTQFCAPREISINRIIAVVEKPDLTMLMIPDIANNRHGSLTLYIVPNDVVQVTLRITGPRALLLQYAPQLSAVHLSSVFASQVANTNSLNLITDETLIIDDRAPPDFVDFEPVDSTTFEATGPDGVLLPADFVQAERDGVAVLVECTPELPAQIGLDINNVPMGPTPLNCTATTENGVSAGLNLSVHVLDTKAPAFDAIPGDMTLEAEGPQGATITDSLPTATDVDGVDPNVDVSCVPAWDSVFPITAPGPATPVTCTALDASGNSAETAFTVAVQDTSDPEIGGFPGPLQPPENQQPYVLLANSATFQLSWGPFTVSDADAMPTVRCTVSNSGEVLIPDPALTDVSLGQYGFTHQFPVDSTDVTCTASDSLGFSASAGFTVDVFDKTEPTITLLGDEEITIELGDPYVDPGATATDNSTPDGEIVIDIDTSAVDVNIADTYTVLISATDASGNKATATRTVIVEDPGYAGWTDVRPKKLIVEIGSSNGLFWGWLNEDGDLVDVSGDTQIVRIREGSCNGNVHFFVAGDPGSSSFRFKSNNQVQYNWQVEGIPGMQYCAEVESSMTGQRQYSPLMTIK